MILIVLFCKKASSNKRVNNLLESIGGVYWTIALIIFLEFYNLGLAYDLDCLADRWCGLWSCFYDRLFDNGKQKIKEALWRFFFIIKAD